MIFLPRFRAALDAFRQPATRSAVQWDAARRVNRLPDWNGAASSPNTFYDNPAMLRARAEGEHRNNPFARRAVDCLVNAVWGANAINPQFADRGQQAIWEQWSKRCDGAGRMDWSAIGAQVLRTVVVSGECFALVLPDEYGGRVPLTVQVLGPEYLDTSRVSADTYGGIRYAGGRPVGYWLYKRNPTLAGFFQDSVYVPGEFVIHLFKPITPGAQRGQTWLAPVLLALRELDEYLQAGLVKAKVSALFAGFVRTADGTNPLNVAGQPTLEPGSMTRLAPNEEIEFSEPPDAGATFDPFVRSQLRRVAAGLGIPYELLSGDYSQVTFASGRGALLEFKRTVEAIQHGLMVPGFCDPILRRWVRLALALGVFEAEPTRVRWIGPEIEMLDPGAETRATVAKIRAGLTSRTEAVAKSGWRVEDIDVEIAADNARADKLGLVLDSDPRKVTQQGAGQPAQTEVGANAN